MFFCQNCGLTEDGVGDGHGRCPACKRDLEKVPTISAPEILSGIERMFSSSEVVAELA